MKVQTIYHTGFVVADLERALEFYTGLLGMVIEREPVVADAPWLAEVVGYEEVEMRMAYVGCRRWPLDRVDRVCLTTGRSTF